MALDQKEDKTRMAGDALEESEAGQVVAEDLSAKEEGFRNSLERRIGTEEYDRIGAVGQDDPTDKGEYSAKEVISEFRNAKKGGYSGVDEGDNSVVDYYKGLAADGAKFNNKARDYLSKFGVFDKDTGNEVETTPDEPTTPEVTTPVQATPPPPTDETDQWMQAPGTSVGADALNQQIQQDNDITNNITGDGNTVNNAQDNSINKTSGTGRYLDDWMKKHNFFG